MSQAKVDRYKKDKANRKQIMKKEKMERMAWKAGAYVILLLLVGWIGVSAYGKINSNTEKEVKSYVVDTTAIDDYMDSLSEE